MRTREAAADWVSAKEYGSAIALLERLANNPETDFDRIDSLRQKSQYEIDTLQLPLELRHQSARQEDPRHTYNRLLKISQERPELVVSHPFAFTMAWMAESGYALTYERDVPAAIAALRRVIDLPTEASLPGTRQGARRSLVNYLERLGERDAALDALETLVREYPGEYDPAQPQRRIALELRRMDLADPAVENVDTVMLLATLWNDPALAECPEIMEVGGRLVKGERMIGRRDQSISQALANLDRVDAFLARPNLGPEELTRLKSAERTALVTLQSASDVGRDDLVLLANTRLLETVTDPATRANLLEQNQRITARIQADPKKK